MKRMNEAYQIYDKCDDLSIEYYKYLRKEESDFVLPFEEWKRRRAVAERIRLSEKGNHYEQS